LVNISTRERASKNWNNFVIGDLFNIVIGQAIDGNKVDLTLGRTAYITRKESNSVLDGFIDHNPKLLNSDYPVITIGNETCEPFVQVYPFYTGTKVNILTHKMPLSANALMCVAQSLKMHKAKYSYSFTINSTRLRKMGRVPVDGHIRNQTRQAAYQKRYESGQATVHRCG
jgi:hypothetical protein